MLLQPLTDKLRDMRFYGLLSGLQEQSENPEYKKLSFEERLGMLVDTEWAQRKERRLKSRIKKAKFREKALMEDLDLSPERGLDRGQVLYLSQSEWIKNHDRSNRYREDIYCLLSGRRSLQKWFYSPLLSDVKTPEKLERFPC